MISTILALTEGEVIALITVLPTLILGILGYYVKVKLERNVTQQGTKINSVLDTGNGSSIGTYVTAINSKVDLLATNFDLLRESMNRQGVIVESTNNTLKNAEAALDRNREAAEKAIQLLVERNTVFDAEFKKTIVSIENQIKEHNATDEVRFTALQDHIDAAMQLTNKTDSRIAELEEQFNQVKDVLSQPTPLLGELDGRLDKIEEILAGGDRS